MEEPGEAVGRGRVPGGRHRRGKAAQVSSTAPMGTSFGKHMYTFLLGVNLGTELPDQEMHTFN
jgi:hypothetical protein